MRTLWSVGLAFIVAGSARSETSVTSVMTQALSQREQLPPAPGSIWRFEGPRNLSLASGGYPYGLGPYSGRINHVAIDPTNSSILYAAAPTGGLWKSTDAGGHWAARSGRSTSVFGFSEWPLQNATAVAVDPLVPAIVYVGTGDYRRPDHVVPWSAGVMRSTDGGLTWAQLGLGTFRDFTVSKIAVDPLDSAVLATAGRGARIPGGRIFRSTDHGGTWTPAAVPDANWDDLALCDGHVYWAAATRSETGDGGFLLKSSDGGVTWTTTGLSSFLSTATPVPQLILLACGKGPGATPFVFVAVFRGGNFEIFGTTNQGQSFTRLNDLGPPLQEWGGPPAHNAFGVTQNRIFIGGTGLFQAILSHQFGFGNALVPGQLGLSQVRGPHGDFQCVVPDPDEQDAIYACNDAGIYHYSALSNSLDSLSGTLGVTQIFRMDVHQKNSNLIAYGAQDIGSSVSFFGRGNDASAINGATWEVVSGSDGREAAFQSDATSTVYLAQSAGGVARYDGVTAVGTLLDDQCPGGCEDGLVYRPNDDALDFAGGDRTFFELLHPSTAPGGSIWNLTLMPTPTVQVGSVTVQTHFRTQSMTGCPANGDVLFVGGDGGALEYFSDRAPGWVFFDNTGNPGLPIQSISPQPATCADLLAAFGTAKSVQNTTGNGFFAGVRLYQTTLEAPLGGALQLDPWSPVPGTTQLLPVGPMHAVVRHPSAPDQIWFVAGDAGVFRTDDGGASWTNAGDAMGLPNVPVRDLRLSGDGNTLFAGTFGRGVWSMDVHATPGYYGVRGVVTVASAAVANATVTADGAGRIARWLRNTLTNGVAPTTGPINVPSTATISSATASVFARSTMAASLVSPSGATFAMTPIGSSGGVTQFGLTQAAANQLIGVSTSGNWRFALTGQILVNPFGGVLGQLPPVVVSANVDFQFTQGIHTNTGLDGEYTLDALVDGAHLVSAVGVSQAVNLHHHRNDVDFVIAPVGTFAFAPKRPSAQLGHPETFTLAYTITDGRGWRDLASIELFADELFSLRFVPADGAFSLDGGPALSAGSPRPLQGTGATVWLDQASVQTNVPDHSSVTLALPIMFKKQGLFDLTVRATDVNGVVQEAFAGRVRVIP